MKRGALLSARAVDISRCCFAGRMAVWFALELGSEAGRSSQGCAVLTGHSAVDGAAAGFGAQPPVVSGAELRRVPERVGAEEMPSGVVHIATYLAPGPVNALHRSASITTALPAWKLSQTASSEAVGAL